MGNKRRDTASGRFEKSDRPKPICAIPGCTAVEYGKGLCNNHWQAARRNDEFAGIPRCMIDGCSQPASRGKMCNTHYIRVRRHGDPHFRKRAASGENKTLSCKVGNCLSPVVARGYCNKHALRIKYNGDPSIVLRLSAYATTEESKEAKRRTQAKYRRSPAGRMRSRHRISKARVLAGATVLRHVPKEALLSLWMQDVCALCGQHMDESDKSLDHIIPLSRGGDHSLANLQMAHLRCNQMKNSGAPRGVYWRRAQKSWIAMIRLPDGKRRGVGQSKCFGAAQRLYKSALAAYPGST